MSYKKDIFDLIGNTPLLRINDTNIYAKLECFNLTGSIKDRAVKQMLMTALKENKINKDTTIIEPTSGNTGISLASICAYLKMKCIIVMPLGVTKERTEIIGSFGAQVVFSEKEKGMSGSIKKALEIHKNIKNSFILDQFNNFENLNAHYITTGKEIYDALEGKIDYLVAGIGTGGTISGIGKYLKSKNKNIKIIGVEPANSTILKGNKKGEHKIFGIGPGFVPLILDMDVIDEIYTISDEEAYKQTKKFIKDNGILIGPSSGAVLYIANKLKQNIGNDKNIVCIFPDSGNRYLSILNEI